MARMSQKKENAVRTNPETGEPWESEQEATAWLKQQELSTEIWCVHKQGDGYVVTTFAHLVALQQKLMARQAEKLVEQKASGIAPVAAAPAAAMKVADVEIIGGFAPDAKLDARDPWTCSQVVFDGTHGPNDRERVPVHVINCGINLDLPRQIPVILPNVALWALDNAVQQNIRPNPKALRLTDAGEPAKPVIVGPPSRRYPYRVQATNLPRAAFAHWLKSGNAEMKRTLQHIGSL